jgi:hypothetical protein
MRLGSQWETKIISIGFSRRSRAEFVSSCKFRFYVPQYLHQSNHVRVLEHTFHTLCVEIGEGCFIKKLRVHDAARGEMVNYKIEEFESIGS